MLNDETGKDNTATQANKVLFEGTYILKSDEEIVKILSLRRQMVNASSNSIAQSCSIGLLDALNICHQSELILTICASFL